MARWLAAGERTRMDVAMKIAVCVKEVPGANVPLKHDESSKRLVREGD